MEELTKLKLSPQEGFLLTRINGTYDLQSISRSARCRRSTPAASSGSCSRPGYVEGSNPKRQLSEQPRGRETRGCPAIAKRSGQRAASPA